VSEGIDAPGLKGAAKCGEKPIAFVHAGKHPLPNGIIGPDDAIGPDYIIRLHCWKILGVWHPLFPTTFPV
jgi:hypothetical protein